MTPKNGVPDQALLELKLTRVQRSPLVIIARARREGPGDEASFIVPLSVGTNSPKGHFVCVGVFRHNY